MTTTARARKLALTTSLLATSAAFAFAGPASAAAPESVLPKKPAAQSAGLFTDLNDLLGGSVGALLDSSGQLVGAVDPTGGVLTDASGQVIGTVDGATGQIFDLSGQLLGQVDSSTGLLLDPLGNIIGGLIPTSQPSASQPGTPQSPGAPGGQGQGNPLGSSNLSLALSGSRSQRLSSVSRSGVAVRATCSHACGVLAAVTVDGRTARRLGLGRGVQPVVIGSGSAAAGTVRLRLTSRARKALSRSLPSSRTRRSVRSKKNRAQRQYRSARTPGAKRAARKRFNKYASQERRFLSSGRVKLTISAVAVDTRGRTSTMRRLSLTVKR